MICQICFCIRFSAFKLHFTCTIHRDLHIAPDINDTSWCIVIMWLIGLCWHWILFHCIISTLHHACWREIRCSKMWKLLHCLCKLKTCTWLRQIQIPLGFKKREQDVTVIAIISIVLALSQHAFLASCHGCSRFPPHDGRRLQCGSVSFMPEYPGVSRRRSALSQCV